MGEATNDAGSSMSTKSRREGEDDEGGESDRSRSAIEA